MTSLTRNAPKHEVEWGGTWYKVRSNKVDIPDLKSMPRIEALLWLNRHTFARGYHRPNPLAGLAGAISMTEG